MPSFTVAACFGKACKTNSFGYQLCFWHPNFFLSQHHSSASCLWFERKIWSQRMIQLILNTLPTSSSSNIQISQNSIHCVTEPRKYPLSHDSPQPEASENEAFGHAGARSEAVQGTRMMRTSIRCHYLLLPHSLLIFKPLWSEVSLAVSSVQLRKSSGVEI